MQLSQKGSCLIFLICKKAHYELWSQRESERAPLSVRVLLQRAPRVGRRAGSSCWSVPACRSGLASGRSNPPSPGPPRSPASCRASNRVLCYEAGFEGLGNPALSSRPPAQVLTISATSKWTRLTSCLEAEPGGRWKPTMLNTSATNGCFTYLDFNLIQIERDRGSDLSRNSRINRIWFCREGGKAVDLCDRSKNIIFNLQRLTNEMSLQFLVKENIIPQKHIAVVVGVYLPCKRLMSKH